MTGWTEHPHPNCCPCHTTRKIAYSVEEAAARFGVGKDLLRSQIRNNYLVARYVASKPIIAYEELVDWLHSLPTEPK